MKKNIIGQNIIKYRKLLGYSQEDLAKKSNLSRRAIAYYEKEANNELLNKIEIIAKALNVSINDILEEDGSSEKKDIENTGIKTIKKIIKIRELPKRDQNAIWKYINFIIEKNKEKKQKKLQKV